jgi:hypothetical protein
MMKSRTSNPAVGNARMRGIQYVPCDTAAAMTTSKAMNGVMVVAS